MDNLLLNSVNVNLQASADCQSSAPASGIVYELFVAGKGKPYSETETGCEDRLAVSETFLLR